MKMKGDDTSMISTTPDYGASMHYLGEKGKAYLAWQNREWQLVGRIDSQRYRHLVKASDTVIDFGCGGGGVLNSLQCARKIGIDINPLALASARRLGVECYAD